MKEAYTILELIAGAVLIIAAIVCFIQGNSEKGLLYIILVNVMYSNYKLRNL